MIQREVFFYYGFCEIIQCRPISSSLLYEVRYIVNQINILLHFWDISFVYYLYFLGFKFYKTIPQKYCLMSVYMRSIVWIFFLLPCIIVSDYSFIVAEVKVYKKNISCSSVFFEIISRLNQPLLVSFFIFDDVFVSNFARIKIPHEINTLSMSDFYEFIWECPSIYSLFYCIRIFLFCPVEWIFWETEISFDCSSTIDETPPPYIDQGRINKIKSSASHISQKSFSHSLDSDSLNLCRK